MGKLFGTDGIRGVSNRYPMTPGMAMKIGQAVAHILRRDTKEHKARIIIGKDTRLSGYMFENALAAGITSMGADAILVGPMPTPGIAFLTTNMDADAGIVISASHNPFEDNGIKVFSKTGFKLNDRQEDQIEQLVLADQLDNYLALPENIGKAYREKDALGRYIVFLKHTFPRGLNLEGMKIVTDCAHGATYKVAPLLFSEMRADITAINVEPDGTNINRGCGALYPQSLAQEVLRKKADIGLAFDGDGDRLIVVDEQGSIVTGDQLLAIFARWLKEEGHLSRDTLVTTVMSNMGLTLAMEKLGIKQIQAKVGDRFVLEEMVKAQAIIGGEDSGHIIFLEHHTTGDGMLSALQLLAVIKKAKKPLSQLKTIMEVLPQVTINIEVDSKPPLEQQPEIMSCIKQVEKNLKGQGRVLVRYSGTQSLCRVMVEGPTKEATQGYAQEIAAKIKSILG